MLLIIGCTQGTSATISNTMVMESIRNSGCQRCRATTSNAPTVTTTRKSWFFAIALPLSRSDVSFGSRDDNIRQNGGKADTSAARSLAVSAAMGGRSIILLKFASLYAAGVRVTSSGNFNVFNTEARSRRLLLAEGE